MVVDKGSSRLGNFKLLFQNRKVIYLKSEGIPTKMAYVKSITYKLLLIYYIFTE